MTELIGPPKDYFSLDNRRLLNSALLLILVLALCALVSLYVSRGRLFHDQVPLAKDFVDPFLNTSLIARSAIVYDIQDKKVIYSKNPDDILPLASLTKVLTAVTAIELLPSQTIVTIKKEFLDQEGDSGLLRDEKWKLSDLIDYSLMVSSNDGANAIASVAGAFITEADPSSITRDTFIAEMNAETKKIGMTNSRFYNESGLDLNDKESGAYGTARDMSELLSYTLTKHPEILSATKYSKLSFTSESNVRHTARNTDTALNSIPAVLGSKTGYTDLAGGNLMVVMDPAIGRPMAIVVLGSTIDGRFLDVQTLVAKTMDYIKNGL